MYKASFLSALILVLAAQCLVAQNQPATPRTVYVTVEQSKTDFVQGLKAEYFKVFQDKEERPIVSFRTTPEPMSIGFMYDVSGSMDTDYVKDLNDAAAAIYDAVRRQSGDNEYFLIGFNNSLAVLADWTSDPETISKGLKNLPSVRRKKGAGNTAIYDACFTAIEKLNSSGKSKKVLIMFTDGADNVSRRTRNEILKLASRSSVLIYSVTLKELVYGVSAYVGTTSSIPQMEGRNFLDDITGLSGGTTLFVDSGSPENTARGPIKSGKSRFGLTFDRIFFELQSQYTIQYFPDESKKGADSVDIKISLPAETLKRKRGVLLRHRKKF